MKNHLNNAVKAIKSNLISFYYFVFISIIFIFLLLEIAAGYSKESWNITEWLINYQGGFVRRGLFGELILYLYKYVHVDPYLFILCISLAAYLALITFFIKSFIDSGYPILILPFVFFLGGPIINGSLIRKDVLLVLIFIISIYLTNRNNIKNLILMNLFFMLGILTHEGLGFFGLPILFLILYQATIDGVRSSIFEKVKAVILTVAKIFPSLGVFILCLYFKGTTDISQRIWDSWKSVEFPIQSNNQINPPAAIDALSWSLTRGLSLTFKTMKNFNGGFYAPLAWILIVFAIYFILTNSSELGIAILGQKTVKGFCKKDISNILVFQLITILPLCILGWDYGRWVFFWISSSFAILILIPHNKLSNLFPDITSKCSEKLNNLYIKAFGHSKTINLSMMFLLGVPGYSWSIEMFVRSSSFGFILSNISDAIHKLLILIFHAI